MDNQKRIEMIVDKHIDELIVLELARYCFKNELWKDNAWRQDRYWMSKEPLLRIKAMNIVLEVAKQ